MLANIKALTGSFYQKWQLFRGWNYKKFELTIFIYWGCTCLFSNRLYILWHRRLLFLSVFDGDFRSVKPKKKDSKTRKGECRKQEKSTEWLKIHTNENIWKKQSKLKSLQAKSFFYQFPNRRKTTLNSMQCKWDKAFSIFPNERHVFSPQFPVHVQLFSKIHG